jgi:hypothetical protein
MEALNLRSALEKGGAILDENQIKFVSAIENEMNERAKKQEEAYSKSLTEALRSVLGAQEKNEKGETVTVAEQLRNLAEGLEKVEKNNVRQISNLEKFQLRKMVREQHNDIVDAIRNGKDLEITFNAKRAAAIYTASTAVANDTGVLLPLNENYEFESEISKIRYPENFILDVISNRQVAKVPQQIIKNEQATAEGAVALVAEGGTKPLVSDTFLRTLTLRKKYAAHIEWTEEFEMDNEMLYNEILAMFEEKVVRAWNNGLISTIVSNGTAYTTSVMDDTLVIPDNGLAVIACQSVINGMNFNADVVLMHPSDIVTTMFTQDTEGNSRLLPYMQNGQINGMRVVSSNAITLGTAVVMDSSVYREMHSDFILRFGTYNDQFIKNQKSAVGEVFSILRIAKNNLPGVMAVTLSTVRAALLKP